MKKKISKPGPISMLLSDETKWCKYQLGITAEGRAVHGTNSAAVKWCLLGAVEKCYSGFELGPVNAAASSPGRKIAKAIGKLFPRFKGQPISMFNNHPMTVFSQIKKVVKLAGV